MPAEEDPTKKTGKFPFLQGILPIKKSQVPLDIIAGITLAALAIPQVLGYAKIAGVPVVYGLYTLLIPLAIFALLEIPDTLWLLRIRLLQRFLQRRW